MNNTKYPEFWAAFLNGMSLGTICAAFLFALVGVYLNAALKGLKRDPASTRTPYEWSWKFFLKDTLPRLMLSWSITIIVIFLSLRFFKELTGSGELTMFYAFGVGFGLDEAIARFKPKK